MSEWSADSIEVRVGGTRLPLVYSERPSSRSSGEPLVYLHGLGSSRRDFEPAAMAPELASRQLIAVDLPGSGESRVPSHLVLGIEDLVLAVESVLEAITSDRVHLIGHSMGGLVGLLVASRNPAGVGTFTNVEGNLAAVDCRVFSRRVVELAATRPPDDVIVLLASELAESGRSGYRTFAERFRSAVQPKAFVQYCRSIVEVSEREPLLEIFLNLSMPRMFIHGEGNRDLPYLGDLRRGGVEVEEIPRADHFPIYTNPGHFFAVLGNFVGRHAGKRELSSVENDPRGGS